MSKKKAIKKNVSAEATPALAKVELSEQDETRLANYKKRAKNKPVKFKSSESKKTGKLVAALVDESDPLFETKMMECFGTPDSRVQTHLLDQLSCSFKGLTNVDDEAGVEKAMLTMNNAMAMLSEIGPRDQLEGLLAVQMIAVHNAAMDCMGRVQLCGQTFQGRQANVNYATKLTRTFISQLEALKKYREGGKQQMVVKHVNVNEGGQAVVGVINQGGQENENRE